MGQLPFAFPAVPSYEPADFLISEANREAYDYVTQPERWQSYGLRLVGPCASGRTHLAHAWAEHRKAPFIQLPVTSVDTDCVLDDVFAAGDEKALFHLLNLGKAGGHKILLVCDDAPLETVFRLPDLLSRLNALPQARMQQPDDILLGAVLRKQLADRQLRTTEEVIAYVLPRLDRSFDAVRQVVKALDEETLARHRELTIPLAKEVLGRL